MLTFSARWKLIISFSSCFAGGVFIAACLLDLLPDVEEKIDQVRTSFSCWQTSAVSFHWSGEEGERLNSREVLLIDGVAKVRQVRYRVLFSWFVPCSLCSGPDSHQWLITSMFQSCAFICIISRLFFPVLWIRIGFSADPEQHFSSMRIRSRIQGVDNQKFLFYNF